jgi:hypothetical protein
MALVSITHPLNAFFKCLRSFYGAVLDLFEMFLTIDQLGIWEVFDSGYEASRSQKLHRQLGSAIRPAERTSSVLLPTPMTHGEGRQIKPQSREMHTISTTVYRMADGETLPEGVQNES